MGFPMHEQSISNSKTEAIAQGTIQNINREIPFYPNLIYRPPPKPTENLQSPRVGGKTDEVQEYTWNLRKIHHTKKV